MRNYSFLFLALVFFAMSCSQPVPQNVQKQEVAPKLDDDLQRIKFHEEVSGDLQKEDFAKLEAIVQEANAKQQRFPGGDWKLKRFYEYVVSPPNTKPEAMDWNGMLAKLQKWNDHYPDSIYANIALAEGQNSYAWELRGRSFANTVSEQQFADFTEWMKRVEKTLNQKFDKRKECIAWYSCMQGVATALSWDREKMKKLTDEAVSLNRLYWDVYQNYAYYLLPRWHGNPGEWEHFAEEASSKFPMDDGQILYSEICWEMSRYYRPTDFFKQNKVSWKRMKYGFIAREKKYGASIRYLNAFAVMAGGAADKLTTRMIMKRIGDRWEPAFWQEKKYFDGFKKWANE